MRTIRVGLAACAVATAIAGTSGAVPPNPTGEHVATIAATTEGDILSVGGSVSFSGEPVRSVGTDPANDAIDPDLAPAAAAIGLEATGISIHRPEALQNEIEFVIKVTNLQAPPPPEVIRYLWQFKANNKEYWIQGKTSDLTTATAFADDPAGTAARVQGAFRLRGECGVVGVVANCKHLRWLDGTFDVENDEVRVYVPLAAPDFLPGMRIDPEDGMTASIQAGVSNPTTSDTVSQTASYTIPDFGIMVGIGAGEDPTAVAYDVAPAVIVPVQPRGQLEPAQYTTDVDVSALAPGAYRVFVRACFAGGCSYASAPFER